MGVYILRRLVLMVPTIFIITVCVFSIVRLLPGDVVDVMYGEFHYAATKDEMRHMLGLDKPVYMQYVSWIGNIARGDLGQSLLTKRTVLEEVRARIPVTLELGITSFILAMLVAIPIGVISAIKQDTIIDYASRTYAIGGLSIPSFLVATFILMFGALWFHWAPPTVFTPFSKDPLKHLSQFVVPALILGAFGWGSAIRMTRTMMLEVLREDYVRTARAKGLTSTQVIIRHALRNAMIPVVTVIGIYLPAVFSGSVIMETIFGLPGLGQYAVGAIQLRDYPVLQAINLVFALQVLFVNLLVDLSYGFIDPRIRFAGR